eukprot:10146704-Ditylum_brightwellii.AAC.1
MYLDLTGCFPYKSSREYEYIYAMYNYNSNIILATALKNKQQAKTMTDAWLCLHEQLTQHGHETKHFSLDNE